jgi:hypothetical protein
MAVPFSADLAERVQQQYPRIGVNPNGSYVGSKLFKRRLMDIYPHEVGPIRLAVNHMVKLAFSTHLTRGFLTVFAFD